MNPDSDHETAVLSPLCSPNGNTLFGGGLRSLSASIIICGSISIRS